MRVPRDNLLDRFGTIDDEGDYSSSIEKASARFFTMLGALVQGRVSVACGALSVAKSALTIAVRYGERAASSSPPRVSETLLMDYLTHQRRLLPRHREALRAALGAPPAAQPTTSRAWTPSPARRTSAPSRASPPG